MFLIKKILDDEKKKIFCVKTKFLYLICKICIEYLVYQGFILILVKKIPVFYLLWLLIIQYLSAANIDHIRHESEFWIEKKWTQ